MYIVVTCYKAEYLTAVGEAKAEAALSYELESSKQQQIIVAEELNVDLGEIGQFWYVN